MIMIFNYLILYGKFCPLFDESTLFYYKSLILIIILPDFFDKK